MSNDKVLISIRNLKQYFPLKKKGEYVKANDGISIDIYEGETFGLVGESGCGKSTLGRTLLQFYRQTDGRTVYYGRKVDDIAPRYIKTTIQNLGSLKKNYLELKEKAEEERKKYDSLDETGKMHEQDRLEETKREAHNAFLNIATVLGGFASLSDPDEACQLYLEKYELCVQRKHLLEKRSEIQTDYDDAVYAVKEAKEGTGRINRLQEKVKEAEQKLKSTDQEISEMDSRIASSEEKIQTLRDQYKDDAQFQRDERYRDDGIDLARLEYNEMRLLRSDLQLIFQDPYSSLNPRMTIGQIIGEGMLAHNMFKKNDARMQEQVLKIMDECGLAPYFIHRYPFQFSGGQRQRVGIARSLAVNPRFVVCDEAVSALDVSIQSQIINLLQDLKESQHLTYMFITHDLSVVKYISDRIGVMYLGVMVELASSEAIFSHPYHPYTQALLDAIPTITQEGNKKKLQILQGDIPSPVHPPKGCKFHTRCKYCTEICEHVTPTWEEVEPNHFVACHHKLAKKQEPVSEA